MGIEIAALQKGTVAGTRATLLLRPEKIGLEDRATGQMMTVRITSKTWMGDNTHCIVVMGAAEVRVSKRKALTHCTCFDVGRKIRLNFQPDSTRVLVRCRSPTSVVRDWSRLDHHRMHSVAGA